MTIAVTHPGKHGDAIYALPAARALARKYHTKVDFYTSLYCEPLRLLFENQSFIRHFIVSPEYVIERMDMGVQPPFVPVEDLDYQAVYHLGFRSVPDFSIPDYLCYMAGVDPEPIDYESPKLSSPEPGTYVVLAPRGDTSYNAVFQEFVDRSPIPVYLVGGYGDNGVVHSSHDMTGCDYYDTAALIGGAQAFVGLMSSQLALANGFPIPRIAPHDDKSWDMRHVVRSEWNQYPVLPSAPELWKIIDWYKRGKPMRYSKTIDPLDYEKSDLYRHIDNMCGVLNGAYTPWATEFRKWEYGTVLSALRANQAHTVLEVGGGSSLFAAAAIWAGFDVSVVDPDDYRSMFDEQSRRIAQPISYAYQDFMAFPSNQIFDAVTCISVIEHVPDDLAFFRKLLVHVKLGGLLCLTTDFHASGQALFGGHNRTYNPEMLLHLKKIAENNGFEVFGDEPDYSDFQPLIHGMYSFASLVLKRTK